MAKTAKILTAQAIARLRAGGTLREIPDRGCPGLYLQVYPSPSQIKSWALRYRRPDGRPNKLVLGRVSLIGDGKGEAEPVIGGVLSLAAARKLAAAQRYLLVTGKDPALVHQSEKQAIVRTTADTFSAAAIDFVNEHARKRTRRWRERARLIGLREENGNFELIEKGLATKWRDKPITEVTADDVFAFIDQVRRGGVPGLERRNADSSEPRAGSVHAVLSKMFAWLAERRRIDASPMTSLKPPPVSKPRDRVLDNREIVLFWRAADQANPPFAQLYKLLLLTGCRLNEVARMEVSELSDDGATWTIPGARTKNAKTHVIPLPPLAQAILKSVERLPGARFVFTTNQLTPISGFSKAKRRLDARMSGMARWKVHDLRRSAATGMADLGVAVHVIESVLNHVSGAKAGVAGTYNRSSYAKEKAEALALWAAHIERLIAGGGDGP